MSRTPPRLKASFSNKPLSKINLRSAYAELRRDKPPAPTEVWLEALMLGRAFDAAQRADSDFFVDVSSPILALGDALSEVLRRSGGDYSDLLRNLEKHDAIEISVALDRMRKLLSPDSSSPDAVVRAVSLSSELLARVRPDPGLDERTACHLLTHGALEAYYLRGASAAAKTELDLMRELIRSATGTSVDFAQPEQKLEVGLEVWEAWQGVQALDQIFGLRAFASEMETRGAFAAAGLALGAEVLMRSNARKIDRGALSDSLDALERFARARGRRIEQVIEAVELGAMSPDRPPALAPDAFDYEGDDTLPDVRAHLPLPLSLREVMTATAAERGALSRAVRRKERATAAIVEDMLSVLERFDILMNGDDSSLVVQLAPMLQQSLRVLYAELELFHPALEAAIYSADASGVGSRGAITEHERDVQALRVLVAKAAELERRARMIGAAIADGGIEVGFVTEVGTEVGPEIGLDRSGGRESSSPLSASSPSPALRSRAEALLIVLRARGIAVSEGERAAVLSCGDVRTIDRWLERAATSSPADVFDPRLW